MLTPGVEEKHGGNDEGGGRKRREELPNDSASRVGERHGQPDESADHGVPGWHEHLASPKPRHHDGCRQERHHDAEKRRGRPPADHSDRTLDPEQHERNSETNGKRPPRQPSARSCLWPQRTLDCSTRTSKIG